MNDIDLAKILADVKEGLVVHPGDQLVLSFPADTTAERFAEIVRVARAQFDPKEIGVTVIAGAEQIVVIRGGAS